MTQHTGPHEADGDEPAPAAPDVAQDGAVDLSLEGLDDLPLTEHVARFTAVHDALRDRLDNPVGNPVSDPVGNPDDTDSVLGADD